MKATIKTIAKTIEASKSSRMRSCFSTEDGRITTWTEDEIIAHACPTCGMRAVTPVKLPQTDKTTHVCHLGFGGYNQGFEMDADGTRNDRREEY